METSAVTIETKEHCTRIWINGEEIKNVFRLEVAFPIDGLTTVTIGQFPTSLEFNAQGVGVSRLVCCPRCKEVMGDG